MNTTEFYTTQTIGHQNQQKKIKRTGNCLMWSIHKVKYSTKCKHLINIHIIMPHDMKMHCCVVIMLLIEL